MLYQSFLIKKYKAIQNVEVNLKNNLIPIIGVNESGKTSLLQAILAFDKANDYKLNGTHLDAKNRYDYDATGHEIIAEILIQPEIDSIDESLFLSEDDLKNKRKLSKYLKGEESLKIIRNLDTRIYKLDGVTVDAEIETKFIDEILKHTPFILYFDDFTDRVPEKIVFTETYTNADYVPDGDSSRTEWHAFIEEIISRATDKQKDLKVFLKTTKSEDRDAILSDVSDKLHDEIIKDWEKLKILNTELQKENFSNLSLELKYDPGANNSHEFQFRVIDKAKGDKKRYFNVSERSKGFQWFFNFAIKLKFNPKYVNDVTGAIYLLDEPGSYLHSSAQEELLKSLKKISRTNKVIYCTHSQYLLNPDEINISSIRIATRDQGAIKLVNYGEYQNLDKDQGALAPLYDALNLHIGKHTFPKGENIVITEGVTDYYFIRMVKQFTNIFSDIEFSTIPGSSVDNLASLISFSIAWSKKYTVIFDTDEQGLKAFDRYKSFFGENEAAKWIKYFTSTGTNNIELENLLSGTDKTKLSSATGTQDVKKGIITLYHSNEEVREDYFKNIDEETKGNITNVVKEIESKLK